MESALIYCLELSFEDEHSRAKFITEMTNRNNTVMMSKLDEPDNFDGCFSLIESHLFGNRLDQNDLVNSTCYKK